ncbi:Methylase involved in ubiquinone/menaquinone biosynthesis [Roseovarius mucosus DSM 17069]|uniref:Methylase involved in ubiquinone/menaquinone biosynthesis n=2 Tax=Roseovarius mucosus TaxID=215743 RepID=A0A0A0HLD2_9RHOB|nr:Methylase involved in ubiquinone/menaquinone biosynthesis [Roseovarius mucosus DSM 17069]
MSLPFKDESSDVVLRQFGVMFFPYHIKELSEIPRVLRPGGRFIFNRWGPLETNDFALVALETLIMKRPTCRACRRLRETVVISEQELGAANQKSLRV